MRGSESGGRGRKIDKDRDREGVEEIDGVERYM